MRAKTDLISGYACTPETCGEEGQCAENRKPFDMNPLCGECLESVLADRIES